jgi:uncharacterized membrane protein YgcG
LAEELLVRLETDGVAVRLNLLGQPGEQPDFVVAGWVLPYVYALRGDRDWRRSPQLTGSRQVSQLAVQAYKLLETGETTIAALTHALGREVTEGAVLRAITELWQQLRIIPVVSAPGQSAQWQLLRTRFQKAIAEGASTSQVTAISVLASIYLQAVIAATMEEVELFLAPLTARSKIREVLRGLVATRQVHTISMGHAPHFYVAGTLPEFAVAPTVYASSSITASAYFLRSWDHEEEALEVDAPQPVLPPSPVQESIHAAEPRAPRSSPARKPAASGKSTAARPHFSPPRRTTHSRDRKPAQSSTGSRPARRTSSEARPAAPRPAGSRPSSGSRWSTNASTSGQGAHSGNGSGNGARTGKSPAPAWSQRNGHSNSAKTAAKPGSDARTLRGSRKPALTAGAKAGNSNRFGFTARPKPKSKPTSKQETKKRA